MLQSCESSIYPCAVPKLSKLAALALLPVFSILAVTPASGAAARKHRTSKVSSTRSTKGKHAAKKPLGPRGIDDARATEIQTALIKAGYLSGQPSGHWDSESQASMVKLQGDNGWQTKIVPDSRALIKLGLGPGDKSEAASTATTPSVTQP